jgi:hypothetical protein
MAAHLSSRLQRLYIFGHPNRRLKSLAELGVEVFLVKDTGGDYRQVLLDGNWAGSSAQRALMLSYPADRLRFSKVSRDQRVPFGQFVRKITGKLQVKSASP